MAKYLVEDTSLIAIADAIRAKTGKTDGLTLGQMPNEISSIQTGGGADTTWEDALIVRNFTEYSNDRVTSIAASAMRNNTTVKKYSFANAKTMGAYAFMACTSLVEVDLPAMTMVANRAFDGCSAVARVHFPSVTSVDHASLSSMTGLTTAIFDKIEQINTSTFSGDLKLKTLVLKYDGLVTLVNVSAFTNTPFAAGKDGGTVYVKQAYLEQYKTATNWSSLYEAGTCNFVALEGSEYE